MKEKQENPELWNARQHLWKAKWRRREKFQSLPKNLKKNIGALIEEWNLDTDESIDKKDNKKDPENVSDTEKRKKENERIQKKWKAFLNK